MAKVERTITIKAAPEVVFDVIADATGYPRYCAFIKKVTKLGHMRYSWRVALFGVGLKWEADTVECKRAEKYAWKSTSGLFNQGSFTLTDLGGSTRVKFFMEYRLPMSILDRLSSPVISEIIAKLGDEILKNVKADLERGQRPDL